MKYIQDMFVAFCQMSINDIDERTVADFEGEKVLGLSHILSEMWLCLAPLSLSGKNYEIVGQLSNIVKMFCQQSVH